MSTETLDTAAIAIKDETSAAAAALGVPIPVDYDNSPIRTRPDRWLKMRVQEDAANIVQGGHCKRYRTAGVAVFWVHDAIENSDQGVRRDVQAFVDHFRLLDSGGVRFLVPIPSPVGRFEERWWRYRLAIPFYFDEVVDTTAP